MKRKQNIIGNFEKLYSLLWDAVNAVPANVMSRAEICGCVMVFEQEVNLLFKTKLMNDLQWAAKEKAEKGKKA